MSAKRVVAVTPVKVRVVREGRLWVLHLDDGGVTQVRRLSEVDGMVADYVSLMRDLPAESVRVEVTEIDPGEDLAKAVGAAKAAQEAATRAVETAASLIRQAATDLKRRGLSGVEVATVLGVSPQRVSQLTAGAKNVAPVGSVEVDASSAAKPAVAAKTRRRIGG